MTPWCLIHDAGEKHWVRYQTNDQSRVCWVAADRPDWMRSPCRFGEALVIPKEARQWPEWLCASIWNLIEGRGCASYLTDVEVLQAIADAVVEFAADQVGEPG